MGIELTPGVRYGDDDIERLRGHEKDSTSGARRVEAVVSPYRDCPVKSEEVIAQSNTPAEIVSLIIVAVMIYGQFWSLGWFGIVVATLLFVSIAVLGFFKSTRYLAWRRARIERAADRCFREGWR